MKRPMLLVAGEGGHVVQARRFAALVRDEAYANEIVLLTEKSEVQPTDDMVTIYGRNLARASKFRSVRNNIALAWALVLWFLEAPRIIRRVNPYGVVAFGPLFCLPVCLWAKILGLKVVHIETWSRFYAKSASGWAMQFLADRIYYQNATLDGQYKNGIYGGRL